MGFHRRECKWEAPGAAREGDLPGVEGTQKTAAKGVHGGYRLSPGLVMLEAVDS